MSGGLGMAGFVVWLPLIEKLLAPGFVDKVVFQSAIAVVEAPIANAEFDGALVMSEPLESRFCVRPIVNLKTKIPEVIAHRRNTGCRFLATTRLIWHETRNVYGQNSMNLAAAVDRRLCRYSRLRL